MAGHSWLFDGKRIATKIKFPLDSGNIKWKSNPTRECPNCQHTISNDEVAQDWPGLPRGVKFDPTDQEIIQHLMEKCGVGDEAPHPFINEFIPTVDEADGICYTHPQNLPGVKQNGSAAHFFHRAVKAYNTGTKKRRKIHSDVRWHKTGRTKPVMLDGVQKGGKKIMVLYVSAKGGRSEKTNWVMHQYHLGSEEDEKEGDYVIAKVFFQQQQVKQSDKAVDSVSDVADAGAVNADPVAPKPGTPEPARNDSLLDPGDEVAPSCTDFGGQVEEVNWSQGLLSSQQLLEGISLCDEFLTDDLDAAKKSVLSEYAQLGPEHLKKDLEECMDLVIDPANLDSDAHTLPDFRLSQLEFGSQDCYCAWGIGKESD